MIWFSIVLVAAFLCRGVVLCCIVPPMEMWDEYQHLAWIEYLHETGRSPVYQHADVPVGVMQQVILYPQSEWAEKQTIGAGGEPYWQFWHNNQSPKFRPGPTPILYEAQQSPLYYWLMRPVFNAAGGVDHSAKCVSVLRLVNVGFGAAALAVMLAWAARACRQRRYAMVIGLWAGSIPLLLLDCARVANDALAFLLAVIVVAWALALEGRRLRWHAAGLAIVTGLGILAKATDLALIPFVLVCLGAVGWRVKAKWSDFGIAAVIFLLIVAVLISPIVVESYRHFGVPFPMQEAIRNHQQGVKISALLAYLRRDHWWYWKTVYRQWFLDGGLWVGGWSFTYPPPLFIDGYEDLLWLCFWGWPVAWLFRREKFGASGVFRSAWTVPAIVVLSLLVLVEMSVHSVESIIAWGGSSTMSWYAAPALPWAAGVLAASALAWRATRLRYWPAFLMPAFFLFVEFFGELFQMVGTYSQTRPSVGALTRLATLHPHWLGWQTLTVAAVLGFVLLAGAFGLCLAEIRHRDEIQPA
jgi:hypothetical protein